MWEIAAVVEVLIATLMGCGRDTWEGFVYPNKDDLSKHRSLGTFSALEECRTAALSYLKGLGARERGDYECGKNCKTTSSIGDGKVCEETLR